MADEIVKKTESSILSALHNDPEKLGSVLVQLAKDRHDKDFTATVISRITEIVSHIHALKLAAQKTQNEIALFEKRLEEIELGRFKVDGYGKISFIDPALNY